MRVASMVEEDVLTLPRRRWITASRDTGAENISHLYSKN